MTRAELLSRWQSLNDGIAALGVDQIDEVYRGNALEALNQVRMDVTHGLSVRDKERDREEERRIIQLYRDGKLVEKA